MAGWTAADMADLTGMIAVVTGANSGIGLCAARELAGKGAHVVFAVRSPEKGQEAIDGVRAVYPRASIELGRLDLADLDSVRTFADGLSHPRVDLLVNNAGVMALPYRTTPQGHEMQFGTNHLGHFALTGRLLARLAAAPKARIVNVSSRAHEMGRIRFEDPSCTKGGYQRWLAYGQSKLANLLFTYEAARRLARTHAHIASIGCHPGYSSTHLQERGAQMDGSALKGWFMATGNALMAQTAEMGALPTLYAATHPEVVSGDYIGPDGPFEMWGHPRKTTSNTRSRNETDAGQLWALSEQLTGVSWP
jgi:NAD(P)-dependent dehydrogenase (short-subunit alcohol dehydrogenase family)